MERRFDVILIALGFVAALSSIPWMDRVLGPWIMEVLAVWLSQ